MHSLFVEIFLVQSPGLRFMLSDDCDLFVQTLRNSLPKSVTRIWFKSRISAMIIKLLATPLMSVVVYLERSRVACYSISEIINSEVSQK